MTPKGKIRVGYLVDTEVRDMLHEMATEDLRTLSATLEILIREEKARRQSAPTLSRDELQAVYSAVTADEPRTITDASGKYTFREDK